MTACFGRPITGERLAAKLVTGREDTSFNGYRPTETGCRQRDDAGMGVMQHECFLENAAEMHLFLNNNANYGGAKPSRQCDQLSQGLSLRREPALRHASGYLVAGFLASLRCRVRRCMFKARAVEDMLP